MIYWQPGVKAKAVFLTFLFLGNEVVDCSTKIAIARQMRGNKGFSRVSEDRSTAEKPWRQPQSMTKSYQAKIREAVGALLRLRSTSGQTLRDNAAPPRKLSEAKIREAVGALLRSRSSSGQTLRDNAAAPPRKLSEAQDLHTGNGNERKPWQAKVAEPTTVNPFGSILSSSESGSRMKSYVARMKEAIGSASLGSSFPWRASPKDAFVVAAAAASTTLGVAASLMAKDRRLTTRDATQLFQLRDLELGKTASSLKNFFDSAWGHLLKSVGQLFVFFAIYLLVSTLIFSTLEGWSWGDSVYFAIVTVSTVGYGDFSPQKLSSRIAICFLSVASLIAFAETIGELLNVFDTLELGPRLQKLVGVYGKRQVEVGVFDLARQNQAWIRKFFMAILGIVVLQGATTIISKFLVTPNWDDAFYFSFMTLSTIGYGDLVPKHVLAKVVVSLLCVFGVPTFALFLGRIVEIGYGNAKNNHIHRILYGLTAEKFKHLMDFSEEMYRRGAYQERQKSITGKPEIKSFEFLCFMLWKNELVSIDDIKTIMDNFDELDLDNNGALGQKEIILWQNRGSRNPPSDPGLSKHPSTQELLDSSTPSILGRFSEAIKDTAQHGKLPGALTGYKSDDEGSRRLGYKSGDEESYKNIENPKAGRKGL